MYKLKYENVQRVVLTEKERDKLIQEGYSLYGDKEPVEEQAEVKKGSGKNGK